jgi:hypothetical protein
VLSKAYNPDDFKGNPDMSDMDYSYIQYVWGWQWGSIFLSTGHWWC